MFHMAYLVGSYIARNIVVDQNEVLPRQDRVLLQLNLAHICTPIITMFSNIANNNQYFVLEKIFDIISMY